MKYFHQQYSLRFVGNNVRAFFQQYMEVLDFDLKLTDERMQEMYKVSVNSVLFSGKFRYEGQEVILKLAIEGDELVFKALAPEGRSIPAGFGELLPKIREYAGQTYWWYFKWVSNGRIFEQYQFDLLEDGTPVKISFAMEERRPFPPYDGPAKLRPNNGLNH